eukprot:7629810-Pyramimonas_sp.AAC.1
MKGMNGNVSTNLKNMQKDLSAVDKKADTAVEAAQSAQEMAADALRVAQGTQAGPRPARAASTNARLTRSGPPVGDDALKIVIGGFPEASDNDEMLPYLDKICSMVDSTAIT